MLNLFVNKRQQNLNFVQHNLGEKNMSRNTLILTTLAIIGFTGCEESAVHVDEGCTLETTLCDDAGILYRCQKTEVKDNTLWKPVAICASGCDEGGQTCINTPNCALGNSEDGACVMATGCKIGNSEDGACVMAPGCKFGNNEDGSCTKKDGCIIGNEEDGSCTMKEGCAEGNNEDGSCKGCAIGKAEDGACIKREGCIHGNELDGSCVFTDSCPNNAHNDDGSCRECVIGNNEDGTCKLVEGCPNGNNIDGSCIGCAIGKTEEGSCIKRNDCIHGNNLDGSCVLTDDCPNNEHNDDGSCKGCIIKVDNKTNNEDGTCIQDDNCKNGWELDGSCKCPSECQFGCYSDGSCVDAECLSNEDCSISVPEKCAQGLCHCLDHKCEIDANHNNMYDVYEHITNSIWNHDCEYTDTKCPEGAQCPDFDERDFCDSFTDKKWSTKCTSHDQCIQQENAYGYHFICREDGRCVPDAFVTKWYIWPEGYTKEYSDIDRPFIFPYVPRDGCQIRIIWGDETTLCNVDGKVCSADDTACSIYNCEGKEERCDGDGSDITHEYNAPGYKYIKVTGEFDFARASSINNFYDGNIEKDNYDLENNVFPYHACVHKKSNSKDIIGNRCLYEVITFGQVRLKPYAFSFYHNLVAISNVDIPLFDNQTQSLEFMFNNTKLFSGVIHKWDVHNIQNMKSLFGNISTFNLPLNDWNVSHVTDMSFMFTGSDVFNQNLNDWDVSKVENMTGMFDSAWSFNQDLSSWKVGSSTDVSGIFNSSGMSEENYCKIQDSSSWQAKPEMSEYTCSPASP